MRAAILVGIPASLRPRLEKFVARRIDLRVIPMKQDGGFRLEPPPNYAVTLLDQFADLAPSYDQLLVVLLPYAEIPGEVHDGVKLLAELGAKVLIPAPATKFGGVALPAKARRLDKAFQDELFASLCSLIEGYLPEEATNSVADAIARARRQFEDTLIIPEDVDIETSLDGKHWFAVFQALNDLCLSERKGDATNKRVMLRDFLRERIGSPKDTYKIGDTDVHITNPKTGIAVHLRERVHLREGRPAETESIYWGTVGSHQSVYEYLIGKIGRHVA